MTSPTLKSMINNYLISTICYLGFTGSATVRLLKAMEFNKSTLLKIKAVRCQTEGHTGTVPFHIPALAPQVPALKEINPR